MTDDFAKDRSCQATPREELERQITSYTFAKNEREWWACREIEKLRARIAELEATITAATIILSESGVPTEDKNEDAFNVLTDAISSAALNGEKG